MTVSPKPENEHERQRAIQRFQILDTPAEKDFDDIVELASQICNCPISLITIIYEERQWFKAKKGLSQSETGRDVAFCAHTIHYDDLMLVPDATRDSRFSDNPLVTGKDQIRFYAGMPLVTMDGYKLGSLCVIDKKPKHLSEEQLNGLRILGNQVVNLLNLRLSISQLDNISKEKTANLNEVFDRISDGFATLNRDWMYTYVNKKASQLLGRPKGYLMGKYLWNEFPGSIGKPFHQACEKAMNHGEHISLIEHDESADIWLENQIYPSDNGISIYIKDITEKKRSEISLEESEEKYRSLVEHASDGIFIINNKGKFLDVNTSGCKLFGYSKEEISKLRIHDILALKQNAGPEWLKELKTGPPFMSSSKLQRKDKSHIFVETAVKMLPDGRILGMVRDISSRLEVELKLLKEKELSDQVINSLPGIFYLSDQTPRLVRWNKKLESISEYTTKELATMAPITLFDPKEQKSIREVLLNVYREGYGTTEATMVSRTGKKSLFFFTGVRIQYEGRPAILGTGIDITMRKKAEESLKIAEERYRHIFEKATEGIYQSTPQGRFITANTSLARMFGYESVEELMSSMSNIGKQLYADSSERKRMIGLLNEQDRVNGFEMRAFKKNNEIIWVRDNIHAIRDQNGKISYFEGTMEDITERKNAEEKLETQFKELQKTNYELDYFVYSVSHDLRAPLASILGLINVSELENPSPLLQKYLDLIRGSVQRLDGFIHDILDYSRNTRLPGSNEKVDFHELISEARNNLEQAVGMDRLNIKLDIQNAVPHYSDRMRIGIVFNNILSNAIKYQDEGKKNSNLLIRIKTTQNKSTILFKDNGIGIDTEHLNSVFDMFYRASSISKGSGLGLYITRETILKLGGSISVDSKFGKFTSFKVTIPNLGLKLNVTSDPNELVSKT